MVWGTQRVEASSGVGGKTLFTFLTPCVKLWLLFLTLVMACSLTYLLLFNNSDTLFLQFDRLSSASQHSCDYTDGKWVNDGSKPLYSGAECKRWLSKMWACRDMPGRTDFNYENYRWKPDGCNLPKFNSRGFLSRMKNKVVAFVGDSTGRQQYQSLMCMLTGGDDEALVEDISPSYGLVKPPGAKRAEGTAQRFIKTNTTVLFYWSVTLCELQPLNQSDRNTQIAMHLDRPAMFIQKYLKVMHLLILNTGHHWHEEKLITNRWVMYVDGMPISDEGLLKDMTAARSFTLSKIISWLNKQKQENATKAEFYIRSLSPRHFHGGDWNSGGRCDMASDPSRIDITGREINDPAADNVVSTTKVNFLNVTYISQFRDDAHVSKYMPRSTGQDCLHWCLPGVPDTWNEILYAMMIWKDNDDMKT